MTNNKRSQLIRAMLLSATLLGFFGALGTAMVTATYDLTQAQIKSNIQQKLLANLHEVLPPNIHDNNLIQTSLLINTDPLLGNKEKSTIYQAFLQQKPQAIAISVTAPDGYSGEIKILIGILYNGEISAVRIVQHKETPGLGDKVEIKRSNWLNNFIASSLLNPSPNKWKVKKDGGEFDQFTGATITPRAVVKAVYKALLYYKKNRQRLYLNQSEYDLWKKNK